MPGCSAMKCCAGTRLRAAGLQDAGMLNNLSGISRFSLRFIQVSTENKFLESRTAALTFNLSICAVIGLFTVSVTLILNWISSPVPMTEAAHLMIYRQVQLSLAVIGACCFLVLAVLRTPLLIEKIGLRAREILSVSALIFLSVMTVPAEWYFMAKLSRLDPEQIYRSVCFSDKQVLMFLLSFTIVAHNSLPIRWHLLVIMEISTLCIYAVLVFLLGTPAGMGEGLYSLLVLTFLVGCVSFGKRQAEWHERKTLLTYLDEKRRRYEMEFELSRLTSSDQKPNQPSQEDSTSVPETTLTGQMWSDVDGNMESFFANVYRVGRAEQWLIDCAELGVNLNHFLGMGGFGFVLSGSFYGTHVALKLPQTSTFDQNSSRIISLCTEVRIMRRLRHPNVVALYGVCVDVEHGGLALVMEMVIGITLKDFINSNDQPKIGRSDRCQISLDLCCALRYLHSRRPRVVHGDLKHSNIMVECLQQGVRAKILDFGLSRLITRNSKPLGGTIRWMAPEVLLHVRPDTAADVFSFGRVGFFLATGLEPLQGHSEKAIRALSRRGEVPRLAWPKECALGDQFLPIVNQCTKHDPTSRPTITEVHSSVNAIANLSGSANIANLPVMTAEQRALVLRCLQRMFAGHLEAFGQADAEAPAMRAQITTPPLTPKGPLAKVPENEVLLECSNLVAPRFKLTPQSTQLTFIMLLLKTCNIDANRMRCCAYHHALDSLSKCCDFLSVKPCMPTFFDDVLGQCPICGILVLDKTDPDMVCFLCDSATVRIQQVAESSLSRTDSQKEPFTRLPANSSSSSNLVAPNFKSTPLPSQLSFVVLFLKSCNTIAEGTSCCGFHDALQVLKKHCNDLSCTSCNPTLFDDICGQCPHCGVMVLEEMGPDYVCFLCGGTACEVEQKSQVLAL